LHTVCSSHFRAMVFEFANQLERFELQQLERFEEPLRQSNATQDKAKDDQ